MLPLTRKRTNLSLSEHEILENMIYLHYKKNMEGLWNVQSLIYWRLALLNLDAFVSFKTNTSIQVRHCTVVVKLVRQDKKIGIYDQMNITYEFLQMFYLIFYKGEIGPSNAVVFQIYCAAANLNICHHFRFCWLFCKFWREFCTWNL